MRKEKLNFQKAQSVIEYTVLFIAVVASVFLGNYFFNKTKTNVFQKHFQEARSLILGE